MPRQRITSYHPIITTKQGWQATERCGIPKFLDGSCRTEPDMSAEFPSITALCRKGKFAPTLHEGDIAVYITVKRPYFEQPSHKRLVAVLEVIKRFETHEDAADWYTTKGLTLPRNCLVEGNEPLPLDHTAYNEENIWPGGNLAQWDGDYWARMREYSVFLVCKPQFLELHNPPIFSEATMLHIFGRMPGTQNPAWFKPAEYELFKHLLDDWQEQHRDDNILHRIF